MKPLPLDVLGQEALRLSGRGTTVCTVRTEEVRERTASVPVQEL